MYLKLSVAGHLTIFLTRTRGPFWSIRPARILWVAVLGTQALATLDRGLWAVHDAARLGLGAVRLGLCAGLVPRERPREAARLSDFRSNCRAPVGQRNCRSNSLNHQVRRGPPPRQCGTGSAASSGAGEFGRTELRK